jgi:Spy/CpxP family protein refolding chaperone
LKENIGMTNRIKRLALGVVATAGLLAGAAGVYVTAQDQNTNPGSQPFMGRHGPGGPMGPDGPLGMLPRVGRELQLTDAQRDQVKAIVASHRDEWKALADRLRSAHDALADAVTADTVDETLIRAKSADVASVEADMSVARAHAHAEFAQILTAEQKTKLKELQAQMKSRMAGRGR